jgi:polyhydroxybutyrate depolymerase
MAGKAIRRFRVVVALLALLVVGTVSAQEDAPPDAFHGPGGYELHLIIEGVQRNVMVYIPASYYDNDEAPVPMVIVLHGAGGTGRRIAGVSEFNTLADAEGFIVVYPDGLGGAWNDARPDPRTLGVDDVGFIEQMIAFMADHASIDAARVYASGYSMGGMLAYRLGCQLPDRIAAVASVASTFPAYELDSCLFAPPVPVLVIQGTADEVIPVEGYRDPYGSRLMLSADETVRYWQQQNHCGTGYSVMALPDDDPADATRVRRQAYTNCQNGADVVLYLVQGGGHTWPGHAMNTTFDVGPTSMDMDATAVIWSFFEGHALAAE